MDYITTIGCSECEKHMDGSCWKDRIHGYDSLCSLDCVIKRNLRHSFDRIEYLEQALNQMKKSIALQQKIKYLKCNDCKTYYME
jgi:hypothetical protein